MIIGKDFGVNNHDGIKCFMEWIKFIWVKNSLDNLNFSYLFNINNI